MEPEISLKEPTKCVNLLFKKCIKMKMVINILKLLKVVAVVYGFSLYIVWVHCIVRCTCISEDLLL